ncbi:DEAD/DEAH box helicase [Streptomyces profundus]|uniref:DEAD/DEAH box helicase n=1 Tax=Streptomyces profundus TaxID=2867410 RepID=UPI001D16AB39|nr:DEAD/DEAH box helicase [Streptomyces sp. MA3_2.13]UED83384.1 DEAD/DEAH box helicase [Streptomyces sp. MA3_2.13]
MNRSAQAGHRPRTGSGAGKRRDGLGSPAQRGGKAPRGGSGGKGRRPAAPPGEFALPNTVSPPLPPVEAFDELELPAPLLAALAVEGVAIPFPIQAATLPNALAGRDVLGRGRTGSGKTLAFGLALLARTAGQRAEPRQPLALVLVPTRELAQQVTEALTPYARALRLRMTTVIGGVSIRRQSNALRDGAEIVVATPGRLNDLVTRGDCALERVAITVLDEADQMTDMGFLPQVTALLTQVGPEGQRMLFSATLDRNVDRLVRRFLRDPVVHSVDPSAGAVSTMEHHLLYVPDTDKRATATEIAARDGRVIMFLDTRRAVDRLAKHLALNGVRAAALHGSKSQAQRTRTLDWFRSGHVTVLLATNVAARGLHVDDLDLVVNVDPPGDHKDYLHRGGRTARAGASGRVVTLVLPEQRREIHRLMDHAGITPQVSHVRSGSDELRRVTGAQAPSGVPVILEAPASKPAAKPAAKTAKSAARGAAPGGGQRRGRRPVGRRSGAAPRQGGGGTRRAPGTES